MLCELSPNKKSVSWSSRQEGCAAGSAWDLLNSWGYKCQSSKIRNQWVAALCQNRFPAGSKYEECPHGPMIIMRTIKLFRFQLIRQVIPGDGPINRFISILWIFHYYWGHRVFLESQPHGGLSGQDRDSVTRNNLKFERFTPTYLDKSQLHQKIQDGLDCLRQLSDNALITKKEQATALTLLNFTNLQFWEVGVSGLLPNSQWPICDSL